MPPPPPPAATTNSKFNILLLLALIVAGLAGNSFSYPIILNIELLFGSIFAMLALQYFGLSRGIVAAAAIAAYTYVLWNHPYAIIIMSAEVAVVGLLMNRRSMGMVLADTLYWLVIGMPLAYIFYHFVMHVPPGNTFITITKLTINGIANALVARLIFTGHLLRSRTAQGSYSEIIYNLLAFFVLCPALVLLAVSSRTDFAETDRNIQLSLTNTTRRLDRSMETWLHSRKAAIKALADMAASSPPRQMQSYLDLARSADVNFLRIGLLDKAATTTAYTPLADEWGTSNIGINFADRPYVRNLKQSPMPMYADVFPKKNGAPPPSVVILAPVVVRGKLSGCVAGVLALQEIQEQLANNLAENGAFYTLLDTYGNIIMTNRTDQKLMSPLVRGKGTFKHFDKGISQWIPPLSPHTPDSERWQESFYITETAVGDLAEWKLLLEQPVAPFQKKLYNSYTGKLMLLLLTLLGSLGLAEILSRRSIDLLQGGRERLKSIISGTKAGTWEWNIQTGETVFNEQWANIIGYSLDEISPVSIATWMKYTHSEDLQKRGEVLESHFRGELDYYENESRMRHKSGRWVWVLDRGKVASWDENGKPLWMFGTHQEITAQKRTEEELRHAREIAVAANLAKSRFLSIAAHEFHTPLHLLTISMDILDQYGGLLSIEEQQEQHQQIRNAARQMSLLINSVTAFNQQERTVYPTTLQLLDIAQTCSIISGEVNTVWSSDHHFHVSISPDCGTSMLDGTLFRRLLENILTNAFRFTPAGGSVSLNVSRQGEKLLIVVADTGIGIPEEEHERIFEAFYRSSNIDARRGLGLGLSIVSDALQELNGNISLTSKAGGGATFQVELPIVGGATSKEQKI